MNNIVRGKNLVRGINVCLKWYVKNVEYFFLFLKICYKFGLCCGLVVIIDFSKSFVFLMLL